MDTISPEYREMNRQLHETNPLYGANGHRYAGIVLQVCQAYGSVNVLDYGCGKGTLGAALRANGCTVTEYDPAIEGKEAPPEPADVVYCGDVAEHIETEYIDAFLDDLARVTKKVLLLVVATRPAKKVLADGRNAHLTVMPVDWWVRHLSDRFQLVHIQGTDKEFTYIGVPR